MPLPEDRPGGFNWGEGAGIEAPAAGADGAPEADPDNQRQQPQQ